ncbi:MAG: type IV pilus biogenesis protein PilP [Cupriavidus sp.]|nr:MAG: type IV pilus biogenesis protein PilP [Cupriavidus sp.]
MQKNSLLSVIAFAVAVALGQSAGAAQEDPAEVVAQQRTLAVWSSISQQTQLIDAQLTLAKKKQELEALQSTAQRAKLLATAPTVRRDSSMPVVTRITGDSGKLFAIVKYPDGQEEERGVGDRLRGSSCHVESVVDQPEISVGARCGKTKTRLQLSAGGSVGAAAPVASSAPITVPQMNVANAQMAPPTMIPVTASQPPLYGSGMSSMAPGAQMKAQ